MKEKNVEEGTVEEREGSEEKIKKEPNIKQPDGTTDGVIHKIGVIVDDNLYTLDDSAHNLVIADTSSSEAGHIKKCASRVTKDQHVTVI